MDSRQGWGVLLVVWAATALLCPPGARGAALADTAAGDGTPAADPREAVRSGVTISTNHTDTAAGDGTPAVDPRDAVRSGVPISTNHSQH